MGKVHVIEGADRPDWLSLRVATVLAQMEVVVHDGRASREVLGFARSDAMTILLPDADRERVIAEAAQKSQRVAWLVGVREARQAECLRIIHRLTHQGVTVEIVRSRWGGGSDLGTHRPSHGMIVFMTGLSGAGKSTLAAALKEQLMAQGRPCFVVDGDVLRNGLSSDLGFSVKDRCESLRRATELSFHLAELGFVVVVALISPFRIGRALAAERARSKGLAFAEVFINAPLAVCEGRDPKNLYKRARAGEIADFTGIDSPYEVPLNPELEIRTEKEQLGESVQRLMQLVADLEQTAQDRLSAASFIAV